MGTRTGLAAIAALLIVCTPAQAEPAQSSPTGDNVVRAPQILSNADVRRYREIFHDEHTGRFAEADKLISELTDRCLMGYVKAEHYLSAHSGRSTSAELNTWLRRYRDLSIADRIHRLAELRTRHHRWVPATPAVPWRGGGYEEHAAPPPALHSRAARLAARRIDRDIQRGRPDAALHVLHRLTKRWKVTTADLAVLTEHVAASYLAEGEDQPAYDLTSQMAATARQFVPKLDWSAGLAAFRLGRYGEAAAHFEALSKAAAVPNETRAAGAFWAARSYMKAKKPSHVVPLLSSAARQEPTFYGLLAQRVLGEHPAEKFLEPTLTGEGFVALMRVPAARRALALWQVGARSDVPTEMNRAFAAIGAKDGPAFAALAKYMGLTNLELRASETEASHGIMLTGLFPVPKYTPEGGYTIDPSLVLAIARIESRFKADAVSVAGARGLMQLMPATARHVAGRWVNHGKLAKPVYNLTLGQRYISELLKQVNGNLFELAAAYNAGPANLARWLTICDGAKSDPLLFIESVPSPETRSYIKRFMMYHWLYRRRLDQSSPTLEEAAAGSWPVYHPQSVPVASAPAAVLSFDAASN